MADGSLGALREASGTRPPLPPSARTLDAREILQIVRRRWREIALVAAAVMFMCLAGLFLLVPRYTATALLLVDPSQQALLTPVEPGAPARPALESARVDSEVEIARSKTTLLAAIDRLDLTADPEFGVGLTLLDKLRAAAEITPAPPPSGRQALDATLRRLAAAAEIARRGLTHVIAVSVTAKSPERAARVANALAEAYIEGQIAARTRVFETARDMLRGQLGRARARLAASTDAFDRFLAENVDMLAAETGDGAISTLDTELQELRARHRAVAERLGAGERAIGRGDWKALSARLEDEALDALVARREAFRRQLARTPPDSPSAVDLERVVAELDDRIAADAGAAMEALRGELAAIEGREAEVTAELRRALQQGNLSAEALARFYELRQEAEIARSQYAALLARQRQLEAQAPIQLADARIVSEALAPGTPSFPNRRMILGVGALLALGLGFAFALARETHFDGITSPERLETVLGLPVAATLPRHPAGRRDAAGCDGAPADAVARAPLSAYAEAVRALRAALDRQLPPTAEAARVVMICSAQAGEGKSTTALALARAHAQLGQRVILVDADLRRPSLHALIGACPLYGLADYLADPHTEPEGDGFLVQDPLSAATLVVGRPWSESATDRLLLSPAFMALMAHLRSIAELVVIDTPPLLGMVDGEILAGGADAAVLVSRFGRSSQAALRAARARLDAALPSGAPVLAVLNGAEAWSAAAGSAPLYYHA